ncbi:putative pYRUVATE FORMATE LYASE ACTIVATING PROTEIN PFLA [Mycobacterium xenopi 3993]|nr:putative pYRUVATE FORMATE LYASE ACTIVATING PROTEIN PFLA [Mycobacterium xenopi 3993]
MTAGYMCPAPRAEFYRHIDAANVDLKAFTEDFYRRVCVGHLQDVLDTLVYLRRDTDVWFEITTLLIPGRNDSDAEITAECEWIRENLGVDVPVHFTAFHPDYKMTDTPPTPSTTLTRPAGSRSAKACGSSTPATCTTRRAGPRAVLVAGRGRGSGLVCDPALRAGRRWSLPSLRLPAARRLRRAGRRLGRRRLPIWTSLSQV